jgi:hypothetical protein
MATTINLSMIRGATAIWRFTLFDNGGAMDLTGASVWFTAKRSFADADPGVIQKTLSGGIAIVGLDTDGIVDVTLDDIDTANVDTSKVLQYDIKCRLASGMIAYPVVGSLTIKPNVTRSSS